MQGSRMGFWDWNLETNQVKRNDIWEEMLGYDPTEVAFTVKQWSDFVHPDDFDRAWQAIQDHLAGRTPSYRMEYRMRTKDGRFIWVQDQPRWWPGTPSSGRCA